MTNGKFKVEAHWTWDAMIIGLGRNPKEDHHLTIMRDLVMPTKLTLQLPVLDVYNGLTNMSRRQIASSPHAMPVLAMTRIEANIDLMPES